jgi:hypothetical protein
MNTLSFTPHSLRSPLASLSLFKRTKKKDWAYNGRAARSKVVPDTRTSVDIVPGLPLLTIKVKFSPKTKIYSFPNGRIARLFSEAKIIARSMKFDILQMGAIKIKL